MTGDDQLYDSQACCVLLGLVGFGFLNFLFICFFNIPGGFSKECVSWIVDFLLDTVWLECYAGKTRHDKSI